MSVLAVVLPLSVSPFLNVFPLKCTRDTSPLTQPCFRPVRRRTTTRGAVESISDATGGLEADLVSVDLAALEDAAESHPLSIEPQPDDALNRFMLAPPAQEAGEPVKVGSAGGWSLEIVPGDFVVHKKYGIGRFDRTFKKEKKHSVAEKNAFAQKRQRELDEARVAGRDPPPVEPLPAMKLVPTLEIHYEDGILHVPVDKAHRLSRYRSGDSAIPPKLSKMKGDTWRKQTERVRKNTEEIAEEVLALYATREQLKRPPFSPDVESKVDDFAATFPYPPTPDQQKCFKTIENDMVYSLRPMDRLVCGDVGFGKTEVALRALFRCVANGRQAALLAPTAVLASQHYKQVLERMGENSDFNITTALMRGGVSANTKKNQQAREELKNGITNLVVGKCCRVTRFLFFCIIRRRFLGFR